MILVRSHFAQAILDFACSLVLGRQHASTCCVMPDDPKPKECKWCFRDETPEVPCTVDCLWPLQGDVGADLADRDKELHKRRL